MDHINLVNEVKLFLRAHPQESQSSIANEIGSSKSTLNQWINGSYPGDNEAIDHKVSAFLDTREMRDSLTLKPIKEFIETDLWDQFKSVSDNCLAVNTIGVFTAEAGLGKTYACDHYRNLNPNIVHIEADHGYTSRALIGEIAQNINVDDKGNIHELSKRVFKALKDSGRLILVDEAEHLPYRALEILRRIHDKSGVGVVLAGMPRLRQNLTGDRRHYAQLYSRVQISCEVKKLESYDLINILDNQIKMNEECKRLVVSKARGNARRMTKILQNSVLYARNNDVEIGPEIIHQSTSLMLNNGAY
jgi:DNA transposition AAA+ family ATPase